MNKLKIYAPIIFTMGAAAAVSGVHGQLLEASVSMLMLAALCLTAYPLVHYLGGGRSSMLLVFPVGYLVHSFGLSLAGWAGGFRPLTLCIYGLAAAGISALSWRRLKPDASEEAPWEASDLHTLLLWIVVAAAITAPAFSHVGAETANGYAYRAYFNTDVFRNMATAGSLVRTGIPPENPYFSGYPLHYYWLFHVIPAFWMTVLAGFRVEFIFVQLALLTALSLIATFWLAARGLSTDSRAGRWLLPLFFFGGSYEGLYVLNHLHAKKMGWHEFTTLNVDGILRWVEKLPQVDTLYRPLLYAPQHLMAVIVFLLLLLLWPKASRGMQRFSLLILVFISVGFSVIIGAINVLAVGVLLIADLIKRRGAVWLPIVLGGLAGIGFLALYLKGFSMFSLKQGDLKLVMPAKLLAQVIPFFIFQWGAILFFGLAGIITWRQKDARYFLLCVFLLLSTIFVIFIQIDVPGLSDVSLKAGYIHHVAMLLFAAKFLDQVLQKGPLQKRMLAVSLVIFILPAAVTIAMDVYNSQDIDNPKFTTYIAKPQMELYRWMQKNVPPKARVEDFISADTTFIESYVSETPPFANCSLFVGDVILAQIFQTPEQELTYRNLLNQDLVQSEDPLRISYLAAKAGIQYLVSFPQRDNPLETKKAAPFFRVVAEKDHWRLYEVLKHTARIYHNAGEYLVYDESGTKAALTSFYGSGFYPSELLPEGEPARWMARDGVIRFVASEPYRGALVFLAHSYARSRTLEVWAGDRMLNSTRISQTPVKVDFPMDLAAGETELRFHSVEGPQRGPGEDHRLLSVKIWELQFRPTE